MNAISMNNLWLYLQGLSLSTNNKRWLGEKLINSASAVTKTKTDKEKKLESLAGVWNNDNGERVARAIMNGRSSDYEREIEPLSLSHNG